MRFSLICVEAIKLPFPQKPKHPNFQGFKVSGLTHDSDPRRRPLHGLKI